MRVCGGVGYGCGHEAMRPGTNSAWGQLGGRGTMPWSWGDCTRAPWCALRGLGQRVLSQLRTLVVFWFFTCWAGARTCLAMPSSPGFLANRSGAAAVSLAPGGGFGGRVAASCRAMAACRSASLAAAAAMAASYTFSASAGLPATWRVGLVSPLVSPPFIQAAKDASHLQPASGCSIVTPSRYQSAPKPEPSCQARTAVMLPTSGSVSRKRSRLPRSNRLLLWSNVCLALPRLPTSSMLVSASVPAPNLSPVATVTSYCTRGRGGGLGGPAAAASWSTAEVSAPGGGPCRGTSRDTEAGSILPCAGPAPLGTQSRQLKRHSRCDGRCVSSTWSRCQLSPIPGFSIHTLHDAISPSLAGDDTKNSSRMLRSNMACVGMGRMWKMGHGKVQR